MQRIIDGGAPLLPASVARLLPAEMLSAIEKKALGAVNEVHLRAGGQAWLTCGKENIPLDTVFTEERLSDLLLAACNGSFYAHADTIKDGFLTLSDGVRIGVVGRAVLEAGKTVNVRDISAICFRIPSNVWVDPWVLIELLRNFAYTKGLLLFSPPGGGKTTALRSLIRALGSGKEPMRVAVVDTRCELAPALSAKGLCVDVLSGYPRRQGIEIAARSMGAQVIVCDEICGIDEARTVLELQGGGVPLVATAHAADVEGLLSRTDIALLHQAGTFGAYVHVDWRREDIFRVVLRDQADGASA